MSCCSQPVQRCVYITCEQQADLAKLALEKNNAIMLTKKKNYNFNKNNILEVKTNKATGIY